MGSAFEFLASRAEPSSQETTRARDTDFAFITGFFGFARDGLALGAAKDLAQRTTGRFLVGWGNRHESILLLFFFRGGLVGNGHALRVGGTSTATRRLDLTDGPFQTRDGGARDFRSLVGNALGLPSHNTTDGFKATADCRTRIDAISKARCHSKRKTRRKQDNHLHDLHGLLSEVRGQCFMLVSRSQ